MNHKIKILLPVIAIFLAAPVFADDSNAALGASYQFANVKVGGHHVNVDGLEFQGAGHYKWGSIVSTASTLTGEGADYDNYSLAYGKNFPIMQSDFFITPDIGVKYMKYDDGKIKESGFGPMAGATLGYNINKNFQVVTHYNYAMGFKGGERRINENSVSLGVNYRFN
ncbi:hypothetical protein CW745_13180 [Psychromonas sp. psych-6C06]|uniref:outer membrane beta-barrel protein n=1 Tax=Psychromonas sp. psych-6C06 TaxID=2058089 RepID=UPI000C31C8AA|nr:outer membrane beta-barrel protein [Psychromonas sp. psych-6C06]PKF60821.1 hypothetical protein CW745_13180 [Psychromonas sp. psych-6C06]